MSGDPRADWDALEGEVDALLDLPAAAREDRLLAIGNDDPARARALRDWLAAIDASAGLLESPAAAPPQGTGPWRAVAPVGEGGMGEVWRGERADGAFERAVAIKFLRGDRAGVAASIARERALLARLRHPCIAQLLDGGVADDGRPWLVMEWVDGRRLDQWLEQARPPLRARVALLQRLAGAVAYAHANLVVHRDLKPANVMVDAAGEPRLLDFGIARLLDEGSAATATVDQAMTPAWAAPEQLRGEPVDARADVHALGALLYFALAGRTPHGQDGRSLAAVVDAVCREDPAPPSRVAPGAGIDADLDAIALKALAREPSARYASADAFAADLGCWLDGGDVAARLPTRLERLRRALRRHPLETALAAGLLLALGGGVAATAWQAREAELARREAVAERDAARAEVDRGEYLVDAFARLFREGEAEQRLTASEWLDRAAALGADVGVENAAAHARFLARLAAIEQDRGQHARAAALLRRVLASDAGALAAADRARAECRLASALNMAGDSAGALAAWDAGIARAEGLPGAERMHLVDCLASRANAALTNGTATPEAMAAARRALDELGRLAGDVRWRRAGVLYSLAALHDLSGDDAEAARRYGEVMAIDRELGNTTSGDHAALLTAMAGSLQRAGDWDAADARYAEGIAIYEALGGLHPNLASDLANLAALRNLRTDPAGALAAADRALSILARLDGANPVAAANAHFARGVALRDLGRNDEAALELDAAAAGYRATHPDPGRPARVGIVVALNELARGRPDAAGAALAPALALGREPRREALLAEALQAQARIARATGDGATAAAAAREAAEVLAARLPAQHPLRRRAEDLANEIAAAGAAPPQAAPGPSQGAPSH